MDTESLVADAFAHLGVEARSLGGGDDSRPDLVIDPDGVDASVEIERRSLIDGKAAEGLLAVRWNSSDVLLVVGDRVTEDARRLLVASGAGYLDLRGHLGLRSKGLVISADVPAVRGQRDRTDALAGSAGLEVAAQLLLSPGEPVAVRALARDLGRSPSTVSEVLGALRGDELIDNSNVVVGSALFWRLAERWPRRRTFVARPPDESDHVMARALRLARDEIEAPGWALTDTAAAVAYGAPVAFRAGQQLDFLVPDESALQRAVRLLGSTASTEKAAVSLRVAPVPAAARRRVDLGESDKWPLAHPLFVALDLAQDIGRGREILDAWTPDERWTRVW